MTKDPTYDLILIRTVEQQDSFAVEGSRPGELRKELRPCCALWGSGVVCGC